MPSPLAKLMTYGGTPINRQADRFLTHKSRKRHGRKQRGTTKVETDSLKRVCPICGKRKLGLEAHMAAKHAGTAVPQPIDQFVNQIFGRGKPASSSPIGDVKAKKVEVATPPAGDRRQTSKTGKNKRRCPICDAQFTRLSQHIFQAHDQVLTECPSCFAEIVVKPAGKRRCGECRKSFTIGDKGEAVGIRAECPSCYNDFYTERLGLIECPTCKAKTFFNGKGKPC